MKLPLSLLALVPTLLFAGPLEDLLPRPKSVTPTDGIWQYNPNQIERLKVETVGEPEAWGQAYTLTITPEGVVVEGNERYAMATLEQLKALSGGEIPCATIKDRPDLQWRGMLHDTGRNWQPIAQLKPQLETLAKYKYNLFQWHITDNHGWRLQSKKYPELSKPENLDRTDNFYTQEEFKDFIAYAHGLGITVLPELDVPGHTECFRRAFGLKKMDEPQVRQIISDLFEELTELLDPKVTPYIHIGSDEVKPHERVPLEWITGWVKQLEAKGFQVVAWGPGQHPTGLDKPLIRQYWTGRQTRRVDEPYFDSQSSYYINHVDPLELLAPATYQIPCLTGSKENQLGAIFAVWHDDAVAKPEDLITMNPVYPAILLYSDNFWNRDARAAFWSGREQDELKYYGNLPAPEDKDMLPALELERRLLAHKPLFKDVPFPYWKQTQMRWQMADGAVVKPFAELPWQERIIAQGTIYAHHFFFGKSNLTAQRGGTLWFGSVVNSDCDQTVEMIADFANYSRSDGRWRDGALVQGKWNSVGAEITINGKRIPPPTWQQPGVAGREEPMIDEPWTVRPPLRVQLKKGRNEILVKLPKRKWKWSFTCFFPDAKGITFEAPTEGR